MLPLATIARYLPTPIRGLFVLFAIAHQLHKLPRDADENVRLQAWSAIGFWNCQVIRALNEDIAEESTRASDGTMTGVLMLMLAEVSGGVRLLVKFTLDQVVGKEVNERNRANDFQSRC